jgi:hypothetical protein
MSYLVSAIQSLRQGAEFSFTDDDYSTIKWDVLDGDAPTQKEIDDEIKRIKAQEKIEIKAKAEQRQAILDRLGITVDEAKLILG